ncbi:MAG TPA: APC family permease, partial [Acidobacteriota bacterium]|nr:APC family permease [Acidobacteriota bacterium]
GSAWLILFIWVIGGIYTLLCANYQAELATMIPKAGGPYVYAQRAYGNYGGFVVGWSDWLGNLTPLAYLPIALAEYLSALVPAFSPHVKVVAISTLSLLALMNWMGLRFGSGAQKILSFLKAVALVAFVIACFALGGHKTNAVQAITTPANFSALLVALVLSFQLVIGTFGGWNSVIYFAEEDRDPSRNIPRSLFGGVLVVISIYLLVNLALLYTLSISQMAASKLPAADAMQQIFGGSGGQIVTIIAVISLIAILNAALMFIPRTLYALGRDRLFFAKAALVNEGGTPTVALSITFIAAVLLMLTGTFEQLFTIYAFYNVLGNILLILSLFILRRREPNLPRPYKTWGYPVAPILLLLIAIALFVGFVVSDTTKSLQASATLAISIPIYLLIKKYR